MAEKIFDIFPPKNNTQGSLELEEEKIQEPKKE